MNQQNRQTALLLIVLVFFFGITEGAIRKWFLVGHPRWFLPRAPEEAGYLAYLSKDIMFAALCLFTVSRRGGELIERYGRVLRFGLVFVMIGATVSILAGVNWVGAFLNVRSMVILPILSYLAASRLTNLDVRRVARWVAVLSFLPAGLGIIQFMLPPSHILNTYANPYSRVITFQGSVRATGTFAFISGMASMSVLAVWAGMFLQATVERKKDFILGYAAVVAGLVCASTAVIRSGMFLAIGLILCVVVLSKLRRRFVTPVVLLLAMLGVLNYSQEPEENIVNSYATLTTVVFERHAKSDSVLERVSRNAESLIAAIVNTPFGHGFGIGQVGGVLLNTGKRKLLRYEHELARIVSEVGLIGLVGTLILRIWIIWTLLSLWLRLPEGPNRNGLLVCAMAVLTFMIRNNAFDHVAAGFSWPLIALSIVWATQQLMDQRPKRALGKLSAQPIPRID